MVKESRLNRKDEQLAMQTLAPKVLKGGLVLAGVCVGTAVILGIAKGDGLKHFFFSYLLNFTYVLSLALGALFFVILQHLTRAGWSASVRRLAELMAGTLPLLGLLALPIIVLLLRGDATLYEWADTSLMHTDHLLYKKAAYLNAPFFVARAAGTFLIWGFLSRMFLRSSSAQDWSGDPALTLRLQRLSGPAMIVFALTLTFFAFDWLMSLEPRWFSTIFGVYFFAGCTMGFLAFVIVVAMWLQRCGYATQSWTREHYHDLGKLLFAFVFFWGYIAFSQYMLIWYANVPEETEWFEHRLQGTWHIVSWTLVIGHFVVPFLGLISRHAKRNRRVLAFWAVVLLVMHWLDLVWLVMPKLGGHGVPLQALDVLLWLGMMGFFCACVAFVGRDSLIVAVKDPRLHEALAFENM